jgi:integrase
MHTWNKEQMLEFIEMTRQSPAYSPYYPLFHVLLYTGMRRSEALALRSKDLDLDQGRISISRGLHQMHDGRFCFFPLRRKAGCVPWKSRRRRSPSWPTTVNGTGLAA